MTFLNWNSLRQRFRQDVQSFPWQDALPRMLTDLVLVNTSMILAFVLWYFTRVGILGLQDAARTAETFRAFVFTYWMFWSCLALLIFLLSGFYTRSRGYASRYKAWVIFQAVSLFVVLFVFADYLFFRGDLVPRGVAVLGWLLVLVTVGGSRLARNVIVYRFGAEPTLPVPKVRRVLVLGGAGHIGSHLIPELLSRGYKVRILDAFLFGEKGVAKLRGNPEVEIIHGDIRDVTAVVGAMKDCSSVIHLAAIVGDPACEVDRLLTIEINRVATRLLIEVAKGYGVQRFVFASTCSVYGASDHLMDEHSLPHPISTYAQTKLDSEKLLLKEKSSHFYPTILRLGTIFGVSDRMRFDLVVNLLVGRAATSGSITIFNGHQWRPFLHCRDAARAFSICLDADTEVVSGQIFNVGSDRLNHQLDDIGKEISEILPSGKVEFVNNEDRRNYRVAFGKIRSQLGFDCEITLSEGVREIFEFVRSQRMKDIDSTEYSNKAVTGIFARSPEAERSTLRELRELVRE